MPDVTLPDWACRECCRTPLCPEHRYRLDGCAGCGGTGDTRRKPQASGDYSVTRTAESAGDE